MDDGVDAVERTPDRVGIADVSDLELHVRREVVGTRRSFVNLRRHVVEGAHAIAARQELVGEVRADEARAARDEN
jgi:hypothetical protein